MDECKFYGCKYVEKEVGKAYDFSSKFPFLKLSATETRMQIELKHPLHSQIRIRKAGF